MPSPSSLTARRTSRRPRADSVDVAALAAVADRVVEQVQERPAHRVAVPAALRERAPRPALDLDAPAARPGAATSATAERASAAGSTAPKRVDLLDARQREHALDERAQPLALLRDERPVLAGIAAPGGQRLAQHPDRRRAACAARA